MNKANYYEDANFGSQKQARENADRPMELDTSTRLQRRFSMQTVILQCMAEMRLDALVYPTDNLPPVKIGSPDPPAVNGRGSNTVWSFLGSQGFPAITVPAGFTTEVYDYVRDPDAPLPPAETANNNGRREAVKLVGPVPARLPIGIDFLTRPFDEATLLRIAAAYEQATRHRIAPQGFGPVASSAHDITRKH